MARHRRVKAERTATSWELCKATPPKAMNVKPKPTTPPRLSVAIVVSKQDAHVVVFAAVDFYPDKK